MGDRNEPLHQIKSRRDSALKALVTGVPYMSWLGITFDRRGDELTAILPFDEKLIGNPRLPAIHGGVTAAFLEVTAIIELSWSVMWEDWNRAASRLMRRCPTACRACPRPSISPSITCGRACRATPMRGRGWCGRGDATPRSMSRHGRTTAPA